MSLTSYLTAPSRGVFVLVSFESFGGFPGLAATYSPTSFDAVPLARRHLTAGFGMGPGVLLVLWPPNRGIPRDLQSALFGAVHVAFHVLVCMLFGPVSFRYWIKSSLSGD